MVDGWMVVEMNEEDSCLIEEVYWAVQEMLMHCVATAKHGQGEVHTDSIVRALAEVIHYSEEREKLPPAPERKEMSWRSDHPIPAPQPHTATPLSSTSSTNIYMPPSKRLALLGNYNGQ